MHRTLVLMMLTTCCLLAASTLLAQDAAKPEGDAAKLVNAAKAETAEVVVRGVMQSNPGGIGTGGWPTYALTVSHVFKTPKAVKIEVGQKLTVKTTKDIEKPATFYLVYDGAQGLYRLQGPTDDRGFSHVGDAAAQPTSVATASAPASRPASRPVSRASIKELVADLASTVGNKRVAATKEVFAAGDSIVASLADAGAKQITPTCKLAEVRRLDAVYSLVDGLHQDAVEGYRTDAFLLRVEKDCTVEEVAKIGQRCGFTIKAHNGVNDGWCAAFPEKGKDFAGVLKAVLSGEPKVITVQILYFVAHPVP